MTLKKICFLFLIGLMAITISSFNNNESKSAFLGEQTEQSLKKSDTILINPSNVNPNVLIEGEHRYLVYFKKGNDAPRSMTAFWTRAIKRIDYNGKNAISVEQLWEQNDTIVHKTISISDSKTMQWLYHESWWQNVGNSSYDFTKKTANIDGYKLNNSDTLKTRKKSWDGFTASWDQYALNWHLDLEIFPILPYENDVTFGIPFYDPGFSPPKYVYYTVIGSDKLKAYNSQEIDCWLLEHNDKGNKEVFWISKQTKEVLKLEQELGNGKYYRYKIKLMFSQ